MLVEGFPYKPVSLFEAPGPNGENRRCRWEDNGFDLFHELSHMHHSPLINAHTTVSGAKR